MDTKLTLRLNDSVIERAKIYARSHKISLSKMIESYLDSLTKQNEEEKKKASITPLVGPNDAE
jgi:predicted HicB family RNase H-like nuclease